MRAMGLVMGWAFFAVLTGGCASSGKGTASPPGQAGASGKQGLIVTPSRGFAGTVSMVNAVGRYAIVSFPVGRMPAAGQALHVYRGGLKVGELKVDTRQMDNLVAADLVTGDCRAGDEVRTE